MDDAVETKRKLETLGDMPAIDMTMAEGETSVGDLEVDDDDEEANRMDQALKKKGMDAMDVDEEEEVRLVRKLDRRILPIACLMYLFACKITHRFARELIDLFDS